MRLYDEYIRRLKEVNDESKSDQEHCTLMAQLDAWKQGVNDASGHTFNGDYYYLSKFDSGELEERPLCCGVFLDWKSNIHKQEAKK